MKTPIGTRKEGIDYRIALCYRKVREAAECVADVAKKEAGVCWGKPDDTHEDSISFRTPTFVHYTRDAREAVVEGEALLRAREEFERFLIDYTEDVRKDERAKVAAKIDALRKSPTHHVSIHDLPNEIVRDDLRAEAMTTARQFFNAPEASVRGDGCTDHDARFTFAGVGRDSRHECEVVVSYDHPESGAPTLCGKPARFFLKDERLNVCQRHGKAIATPVYREEAARIADEKMAEAAEDAAAAEAEAKKYAEE